MKKKYCYYQEWSGSISSRKKERTVVVTGAAQGIGYAIAEAFVNNGDFVAICDINLPAAESAANKLQNAKGYKVNVTDEEDIKSFVQLLTAERGTVDVLVNNAGLQHMIKLKISL